MTKKDAIDVIPSGLDLPPIDVEIAEWFASLNYGQKRKLDEWRQNVPPRRLIRSFNRVIGRWKARGHF